MHVCCHVMGRVLHVCCHVMGGVLHVCCHVMGGVLRVCCHVMGGFLPVCCCFFCKVSDVNYKAVCLYAKTKVKQMMHIFGNNYVKSIKVYFILF